MVQWLRSHLPMQGTQIWSPVREDCPCCRATRPVCHNYSRICILYGPAFSRAQAPPPRCTGWATPCSMGSPQIKDWTTRAGGFFTTKPPGKPLKRPLEISPPSVFQGRRGFNSVAPWLDRLLLEDWKLVWTGKGRAERLGEAEAGERHREKAENGCWLPRW